MMRFAYVVSAGVCLAALAPLSAEPLPPVELTVDPWQGVVAWSPPAGETLVSLEKPVHGSAEIESGQVVYTPTPGGDFWSVGSDRWIVMVATSEGALVHRRLTARAGSPIEGPPTTHFEPGEALPPTHDDFGQIEIGAAGALLGEGGALIALDGKGREAYFEYQVIPHGFRGTNNSDAGCADLRMGLGTPESFTVDNCQQDINGVTGCSMVLISAVPTVAEAELFRLELGVTSSETLLRGVAYDAWGGSTAMPWTAVSGGSQEVRMDWWTGDSGGMRLRIDGRVRGEIRDVASPGIYVGEMRVGAPVSSPGLGLDLAIDAIRVRNGHLEHDSGHVTADPFEEDLALWHAVGTAGGGVSVARAAALGGYSGLELALGAGGWGAWILDRTPAGEDAAGLRFRLDTDALIMADDDILNLVHGQPTDGPGVESRFLVRLWQKDDALKIRASTHDDYGVHYNTPYAVLSAGDHLVELTWRAASEVGSSDGRLRFWLDGQLIGELTALDNYSLAIESVRFGAMFLKPGTGGTLYLDEFESWR